MKQFNTKEQKDFWSEYRHDFSADLISNVIISMSRKFIGKKIIDVGAGSGSLASKLKNVTAIDLAPKNEIVIKGDCTDLKFENDSFDTVFCTDVIEHLNDQDLKKCLSEINRVLVKEGHAILTTNYNENLAKSVVICPDCDCKFHKWGHCQSFDEKRIKALFKENGFEIKEFKKLNIGFVAVFKFLGKLFYKTRMDKIFKNEILQKNIFLVVKKI